MAQKRHHAELFEYDEAVKRELHDYRLFRELYDIIDSGKNDEVQHWLDCNEGNEMLLQAVSKILKRNEYKPPLHLILLHVKDVSLDVVERLLKIFPESVTQTCDLRFKYVGGLPLHIAIEQKCSEEIITKLVIAYQDGLKVENYKGELPLHVAIRKRCSFDIIEDLVKAYPDGAQVKNNDERLPLHIAISYFVNGQICSSHVKVLTLLLEAYKEGTECEDNRGLLPLHSAVRNRCPFKVIKMLVEAYPESLSVETENNWKCLPLHLAVVNYYGEGDIEILKFMLKQYPKGMEEEDSEGNLPLHCAIMNSDFSLKTLKFLLKAYPQGAQVKNKEGNLPLHIAVQCGVSLEFVQDLVVAYGEGVTMKNNEKQLPLHEVVYCHSDIVYSKKRDEGYCDVELLNYMLGVYKEGAKHKDRYDWLPLHTAIYFKLSPEIVKNLISVYPEALSVKANETESEHFGNLPLHTACQCKSSQDIVRILLTKYPEGVTTKNGHGELPLHHACQHENNVEVIKMLLEEYRGGLKVSDNVGWLPLHVACARRTKLDLRVLNLLVECHPEGVIQKNIDGDDPSNLLSAPDPRALNRIDGNALARLTSQHVKIACALHEAVVKIFSPHLVKLLIKASPESCTAKDQKGRIPLHHACASNALGSLDIVIVLLEACQESFMMPDEQGITPTQLLSEVTSRKNHSGMLPLHRHARYSERFTHSALRQLFNAYPKGIEERDNRGMLPFHHACLNTESSVDILMLLLQLYPQSIAIADGYVPSNAVTQKNTDVEIL